MLQVSSEEILFEVSTDILELEEFNEDTFKKNKKSIKCIMS